MYVPRITERRKTSVFQSVSLETQESFGDSGVAGRKIIKFFVMKYKVRLELYS